MFKDFYEKKLCACPNPHGSSLLRSNTWVISTFPSDVPAALEGWPVVKPDRVLCEKGSMIHHSWVNTCCNTYHPFLLKMFWEKTYKKRLISRSYHKITCSYVIYLCMHAVWGSYNCIIHDYVYYIPASSKWPFDNPNGGHQQPLKGSRITIPKRSRLEEPGRFYEVIQSLGIQSPCQMMIGVYNHLLSKVFRFHYHSQKVIGSLGHWSKRKTQPDWNSKHLVLF